MSSISPVGPQQAAESLSGTTQPPFGVLGTSLDTIAGMLSMSPSDLQAALKSGQSISDLASQKGVSLDSIVQSVESQIQQQRAADGKPPIDQSTLDARVNRAVHHHHGHHHRTAPPVSTTDTTGADGGSSDSSSVPATSSNGSFLDLLA